MALFGFLKRREPPTPLIERVETLERVIAQLRLEWEETYEKIARLMGRIAKRQAVLEERESRQDAPESRELTGGGDDLNERIRRSRRAGGA